MSRTRAEAIAFVQAHTTLARPPLVPELELFTATEVTPLWQVTQGWLESAGLEPPYWAFAWAGGQALARFILDHPETVRGKSVLDFACGGGVVAIAASRAGAARVVAVDTDPLAVVAASLNAAVNGANIEPVCHDVLADAAAAYQVVLAGDVFFDAHMARRVEPWLRALASRGVVVRVGDPARAYVPQDFVALARLEVPVTIDLEGMAVRSAFVLRPPEEAPAGRGSVTIAR